MFKKAKPIWLKGLAKEINIQASFVTEFTAREDMLLSLSGATFYKVFLNGKIIHHGPSPTSAGYARVDRLSLCAAAGDACTLEVEVAGYNADSYAAVNQPSFFIAEITSGTDVVAATGYDFSAYRVASRIRETLRYSLQRHFSEVWDLTVPNEPAEWEYTCENVKYIERNAPLPILDVEAQNNAYCKGKFTYNPEFSEETVEDGIDAKSKSVGLNEFPLDSIKHRPHTRFSALDYSLSGDGAGLPVSLSRGELAAFEFGYNSSALISLKYRAKGKSKIIIAFDEALDGDRLAGRLKALNVIEVTAAGDTEFQNFEIYGFKYLAVFVVSGEIELREVSRVLVRNSPEGMPTLNTADCDLLAVYGAALESFRCNSLGIFTDCPTRERAGWLCDSYFIARVAHKLMGNTFIEDDFLENYRTHGCKTVPVGMVPMCYPAEHPKGRFIPQWSMWLVLELLEYRARCPYADMELFRDMTYGLVGFFAKYENELGLLEDLPSWNFVEWSRANDWCEGVNFPTNMLYSEFLRAVAELYGDKPLAEKAEKIRDSVRALSFDGKFFRDQATRDASGALSVNTHISEACQYYAFYFGVADEETYAPLKATLINEFGPSIDNYPDIEKANALMGIYLRIDLLVEWGMRDMCIDEIKGYFLHMARLTGTLWEHKTAASSLNHGFPSYIAAVLLELFNK